MEHTSISSNSAHTDLILSTFLSVEEIIMLIKPNQNPRKSVLWVGCKTDFTGWTVKPKKSKTCCHHCLHYLRFHSQNPHVNIHLPVFWRHLNSFPLGLWSTPADSWIACNLLWDKKLMWLKYPVCQKRYYLLRIWLSRLVSLLVSPLAAMPANVCAM